MNSSELMLAGLLSKGKGAAQGALSTHRSFSNDDPLPISIIIDRTLLVDTQYKQRINPSHFPLVPMAWRGSCEWY